MMNTKIRYWIQDASIWMKNLKITLHSSLFTILSFSILLGFGCKKSGVKELVYLRNGGEEQKRVIEPQIRRFEELNPGIQVKLLMVPWEQGEQKLINMIATESPPDLAYVGSRHIPLLAEMKALLPLDIPSKRQNEYFDGIWKMVTWEEKIYGIPRAFSTKTMYYNTELFEQVGILKPPETWRDLYEAANKISEETEAYGFALAGKKFVSTTTQFFNFVFQNGGEVVNKNGQIVLQDERNVEALKFYLSLAQFSEPGPTAYKREDLSHLFREGKVGMYISGPWRRKLFDGANTPYQIAPLPSGPRGRSSCTLVSDSIVLFKSSKYPLLAQKLALFLTNWENQIALDTLWGMTPMRVNEAELDYFQSPTWKPFIEMIPRGKPQPLVRNWKNLEDAVTEAIQGVLLEKKDPSEALIDAESVLKKAL
jgi:multiple sugar transport system substrate-binding protein